MRTTFTLFCILVSLLACTSPQSIKELQLSQAATGSYLQELTQQMVFQGAALEKIQASGEKLQSDILNIQEQLQRENTEQALPKLLSTVTTKTVETKNSSSLSQTNENSDKMVLGKLEWVWLDLLGQSVKAQMNTGLKRSQINASYVQRFERDGSAWLRFSTAAFKKSDNDSLGESSDLLHYETPIQRTLKIRNNGKESATKRPMIRLKVKLGEWAGNVDFLIYERPSSQQAFHLGQSFLKDIAVVDVAREFTRDEYVEAKK